MGNLRDPNAALALFGLLLIASLHGLGRARSDAARRSRAPRRWARWPAWCTGSPQSIRLARHLGDRVSAGYRRARFGIGLLEIVFVFLFVDLFDNVGTLVAVGKKAGLFDKAHRIPRMNRILLTDSLATMVGSLAGTSTVVSYIESAAGVAAGGRTGVTSIVTGLLFLAALFVAPLIGRHPGGGHRAGADRGGEPDGVAVAEIEWDDLRVALPAFLTMITIPLTFSIANGLAFGLTSYVRSIWRGGGSRTSRGRRIHWRCCW